MQKFLKKNVCEVGELYISLPRKLQKKMKVNF